MSENNYNPIFNCEADFQQLWKQPYGETKCFREAVDDIVENSFVYRSFRNEYETDNLFNQRSINLLKTGAINFNVTDNKETEDAENVYIPGYKVQSFLPSSSELSKQEMKECFPMYADICSNKSLTDEKLAIYNKYHDIIKKEQLLYQEIAKSAWFGINFHRANEIRPEVAEYTNNLWKKRLERVSWYPKHYMKCTDISLIDDTGRKSELTFSKQLKSLGERPECFMPSLKQHRVNIFKDILSIDSDDFSEFNPENNCKYYKTIHSTLSGRDYHPDVSKDKVCELLALQSGAKIVMSASGFLCLLDNHPGIRPRSWELPIVIKEYKEGVSQKKIVYIDKVFPPKSLTAVDRLKWFCKKKIYKLLHHANCINFKKPKINKKVVSYDDLSNLSTDSSYDISKLECFGIESSNVKKQNYGCSDKKPSGNKISNSQVDSSFSQNKSISSTDDQDCSGSDNDYRLFSDSENELTIDIEDEPSKIKKQNDKIFKEASSCTTVTSSQMKKQPDKPKKLQEKIIYNLYSMRCETSNVLLKSNLKDLDIIIRCKEGATNLQNNKINHVFSTKIEYQPEFGAEVLTLSEITRDWGNCLIRPDCRLQRVRLDALSGDLIMYETKTFRDLTIEFQRQHSKSPYDKLSSLHTLLGQLTELSPGNYLLSHSPDSGTFAQLYKEEKSRHNYNSNLGYLQVDCTNIAPSKAVWLQIDHMVLTPTCAHFCRIPATFYPKATKCSSKLDAMSHPNKVKELKEKALIRKRKRRNQKKNKKNQKKTQSKNKGSEHSYSELPDISI